VLELKELSVNYGSIRAVRGASLVVGDGEIVALIGANGAGKSTILQAISGLLKPSGGDIALDGASITGLSADKIVKKGVIQVPEGRQIFSSMTVTENLRLGAFSIRDKAELENRMEAAFKLFPVIKERRWQLAGTLSGGEQQMLAIGRGLMANPKVLLLDEPSLGLSPLLTQQVFDVLRNLKHKGITMLLVEQNACEALEISDRAYVLETGVVSMSGASRDLQDDPHVKTAYLGR
jgi:branched-chain amino acid transport system ATP-binding protein